MKRISFNISQFLLISLIAALIVSGIAVSFKDKSISPKSQRYFMVVAGEWIDVNFLTFSAQGKQDKHLQFSSRRLQEFLEFNRERLCHYV